MFPKPILPLAQASLVLVALAAFAFAPPAQGRMLLLPITGAAAHAVPLVALAGGAALLGVGPVPGSLVVDGRRDRFARDAVASGIIILSAPPSWCGDQKKTGAVP